MQAAVPELRPLSIGEILDVAIKIYVRNAVTFFLIVLTVVAPVQFASSLVQVSVAADESGVEIDPWLAATGLAVVAVLSILSSALSVGASFKAVSEAYLGGRPNWKTSLAFAARRIPSILWVFFLGFLIGILAIFACFVGVIVLVVLFSVAVPALLMENAKGWNALSRSVKLVSGRFWGTLGILTLGALLVIVVTVAISVVLGLFSLSTPENDLLAVVAGTIGGTISSMLTTPFIAAVVTVLYFDLRVRREGFDLQLLAERIGLARRAAQPAGA